jgi:hypothetical protein
VGSAMLSGEKSNAGKVWAAVLSWDDQGKVGRRGAGRGGGRGAERLSDLYGYRRGGASSSGDAGSGALLERTISARGASLRVEEM